MPGFGLTNEPGLTGGSGLPERFDLHGKVALVTGSTRGIGYGIARSLASQGADLVVTSRSQTDCDAIAEELRSFGAPGIRGPRVLPQAADVASRATIERLAEEAISAFGRIDILVNNAGTACTKPAEELTEEDWDLVIDVDLKGVFLTSIAVGRKMIAQRSGKIINIASMLGLVADRQILPYCVAKGGVIQMTRALALEWAKHNIQVNALCPGYVMTAMNEQAMKDNERIRAHILDSTPMRRLATIDELTGAVAFLASDASNYMTGQTLVIDGGWTAQ
ncbi:MAG: glucose 1-dehydrogenase [Actinobacteria bacterium]|nr:glucose 1-dehydrogenase [Actinomycetota bacterium]